MRQKSIRTVLSLACACLLAVSPLTAYAAETTGVAETGTGTAETNVGAESVGEETQAEEVKKPAEFIIDTDFSSDIDDAFAISTAMYFQDMGMINVRAVALCAKSARAGWAMSALLAQHKQWNIPICVDPDYGLALPSDYVLGMSNYPHKEDQFTDIVSFYRMMIASSVEPVNIVTLGQLINIEALLESGPDVHSPLTGAELVAQKVDTLYVCGTKYTGKSENNLWYSGDNYGGNRWYGNTGVTDAAINVAKNWPGRVLWIPSEVGGMFNAGGSLVKKDWGEVDILANGLRDFGMTQGCIAFDPAVIYVAAYDANDMLAEKGLALEQGTMRIYGGGGSAWALNDPTRQHERVQKLLHDNFYMTEINELLEFEYYKRHPEQVGKR